MPENGMPGPVCDLSSVRESVCIHTRKIFDSCRDKDCVEDLRFYPTASAMELLSGCQMVRGGTAELLYVYTDVEPVTFYRGVYSIDMRFFYRVTLQVGTGTPRCAGAEGLCVFDKRCILFGSEGSAKIFSSDTVIDELDIPGRMRTNLPTAVVEAVDPIVLDTRVDDGCKPRCCECGLTEIPDFIARKHGRSPIVYDIPVMEKYLKDTYGITVYQEQVMLLSRLLADFTRGESDALRKAMGKKLRDKLDHMKPKFIEGGKKNGHDPKVLEKIWADWEKFASYAFNKSHATCYSWVAYQTAYLKANYPSEYMAATMSRNISNITEITKLMDESKATGIRVLGPDVNESLLKFSVNRRGDIRFGLGAIKGVGESAVQSILSEREKNGPYKSIFDFVQRVNLSACNRKNIENLALAGGFDSFGNIKREDFFMKNSKDESFVETLVRYGSKYQMDKAAAINSLFGGEHEVEVATPEIISAPAWSDLDRLN